MIFILIFKSAKIYKYSWICKLNFTGLHDAFVSIVQDAFFFFNHRYLKSSAFVYNLFPPTVMCLKSFTEHLVADSVLKFIISRLLKSISAISPSVFSLSLTTRCQCRLTDEHQDAEMYTWGEKLVFVEKRKDPYFDVPLFQYCNRNTTNSDL